MNCLETLDAVLTGGLANGRWCWFHDTNNQALGDRFERDASEYLESLEPVCMPLRINCRNTRVILDWIQDELDADLGVAGAGAGPAVRRKHVANRWESALRVAGEIRELVDVGGLAPGSVTILSPLDYAESTAAMMPREIAHRVRRLDDYSMRRPIGDRVGFATIAEFKGLENEAIIVADLPAPSDAPGNDAFHYVAMSRARSVLSLVHMNRTAGSSRSNL